MIERVLVAMDGSDLSERALRYALDGHPDAEITVLTVVGGASPMMGQAAGIALSDDGEDGVREAAAPVFERAREIAAEYDATVETAVETGRPARQIIDRAEEFDVVVLGTHSGSLADRLFVGNVAKTVFQRSPVPVTVVR
ncbi:MULTISPECIES: universal stress protein [Halorubrum]|jgi:nucleotide-binding universal stress UspA family protein|uniref:Universal stress protein n=1 Tax=Halorubrum tropicale TaxID=1765655 RepID=A0A0N0UA70_9EURY|nr:MULTISPECIES: universal stress protein [Halorubrum]KOX95584.1 universal stress protein [Halorubrum tropicale]RLM49801.1 universal stress protein [Halorubrum sp. Atlit-28R]TKX45081.1 universal stress protein [Halorubrum sp. ARQ200]